MQDSDCVRFLQWALPQMQMRWAGFRKVRKQVCQRLAHRLIELNLNDIEAYQHHLDRYPNEWHHLDALCRVVVTRFYRDQRVFAELTTRVLPQLASDAIANGRRQLRAWSIGSASGEEPYTLAILWRQLLAPRFPQIRLAILGTEIDPHLLERSHAACYAYATLKNLPDELRSAAFTVDDDDYFLKEHYRSMVEFRQQDIRSDLPDDHFDLILCRNLVFTYFGEPQQRMILHRLLSRLRPGGWLVVGVHETLPVGAWGVTVRSERLGLYQRPPDEGVMHSPGAECG